jgi:hypothetical protein
MVVRDERRGYASCLVMVDGAFTVHLQRSESAGNIPYESLRHS